MKLFFKSVLPIIILLSQVQSNAQTLTKFKYGVYLHADDFIHNKVSYGFDQTNRNNKLILFNTFGSSKIQIRYNSETKSFAKNNIYGYRMNGVDYRLANGDDFTIIDTADFFIYGQTRVINQVKWWVQKATHYYFSLTANSKIEPLTIDNIENALDYNKQFDHYLNTTFKSDKDLISYDSRIKKYKLKYLYEEYDK